MFTLSIFILMKMWKGDMYLLLFNGRQERVPVHPVLQLTVSNIVLSPTHLRKKISV